MPFFCFEPSMETKKEQAVAEGAGLLRERCQVACSEACEARWCLRASWGTARPAELQTRLLVR